jgi:hypothetical protein
MSVGYPLRQGPTGPPERVCGGPRQRDEIRGAPHGYPKGYERSDRPAGPARAAATGAAAAPTVADRAAAARAGTRSDPPTVADARPGTDRPVGSRTARAGRRSIPVSDPGSRDYEDVEEAARELGAEPAGPSRMRPVEESDETAAAVDDDAPVPDLAPQELDGEPDLFRAPDER